MRFSGRRRAALVVPLLVALAAACSPAKRDFMSSQGSGGASGGASGHPTSSGHGGESPASSGAAGGTPSCDKTRCGTACVDTDTSAADCGTCGHDCGGGTCSGGVCQPVVVASNVSQPLGVAVASNSAFWLRAGVVERCPITGCTGAPFTITDDVTINNGEPGGTIIVTDGSDVAWIAFDASQSEDNAFACSVAGCNGQNPTDAVGPNDAMTQIAIFGSNLYGSQATGTQHGGPIGTLMLAGIGGSVSDAPTGVAADASNLYVAGADVSGTSGAGKVALSGGPSLTRLFNDANRIAVANGTLYATSTAGIVACAVGGCGAVPKVLDATSTDAAAIAADDKFVVWADTGDTSAPNGDVRVCAAPACKGGPRVVAKSQAAPVGVALSGGFVYWANMGASGVSGSIWRAAL